MNGLIVGDWEWDFYEKALAEGFTENGCRIDSFKVDVKKNNLINIFQSKIKSGPLINEINKDLIKKILSGRYDFIFFYRPHHFKKSTLLKVKKELKKKILCFHNDNPFHQKYQYFKYKRYFEILPLCDLVYVYRPSNLKDAQEFGAKNVKVLMPYYIKGFHDKKLNADKINDVIFIGHYEDDGRADMLEYLIQNNIELRIIGWNWTNLKNYEGLKRLKIKQRALGIEYIKEIKSAKIALVFLSALNKDVYTRRNFEIPAIGTFMLSQETDTLKKIFIKGTECDYFCTKEELLEKIKYYLINNTKREKIALNGKNKCRNYGFDNVSAAGKIINDIRSIMNKE